MLSYRICRLPFIAIDGEGARRYGGRWNSVGRSVVYSSGTLSLAALEYLIHVDAKNAPADLVALTIEIPKALPIDHVPHDTLPQGWQEIVDVPACRTVGDEWLARRSSAVLAVPSAAVMSERIYLMNPVHPDAVSIRVIEQRAFSFDPRLMRR